MQNSNIPSAGVALFPYKIITVSCQGEIESGNLANSSIHLYKQFQRDVNNKIGQNWEEYKYITQPLRMSPKSYKFTIFFYLKDLGKEKVLGTYLKLRVK